VLGEESLMTHSGIGMPRGGEMRRAMLDLGFVLVGWPGHLGLGAVTG